MIGRQKDMHRLIKKLLSDNTTRLVNVFGLPGVGKSALTKCTLHHLQKRSILKGGVIYHNANKLKDCEVLVKQLIALVPIKIAN